MSQFLSNIGDAKDLRERILFALVNNQAITLTLDIDRTVVIDNAQSSDDEMVILSTDVDDGTIAVLHLPHADTDAPQAYIIPTGSPDVLM